MTIVVLLACMIYYVIKHAIDKSIFWLASKLSHAWFSTGAYAITN